ncbi:MAG: ABC transporter permease subunit [Myxococcales bacterium]|nr:ABC transporter permease subunit [Myxococcales bacterium]
MLLRIFTVALNAYREAVRARVLLGLTGVAFAVAIYSLVVGAFTLDEAPRVVADLGAAAISIFSIAVAILVAATSLHRELEMKTILPLLARPIRRGEYLVGKYLGTLFVVLVFVLAEGGLVLSMSAALGGRNLALTVGVELALLALLALAMWRYPRARTFGPIPWAAATFVAGFVLCGVSPLERSLIVSSSLLTVLEVAIIAAVATLFSSFSTPFLSSLLTVGAVLVGRNADALARLPVKFFGPTVRELGKGLAAIVPNLQIYVPARPLLTGEALEADLPRYLAMASLQSLGWMVGLLAAAILVFQRRDFQ